MFFSVDSLYAALNLFRQSVGPTRFIWLSGAVE
jgi:hypothetical protein